MAVLPPLALPALLDRILEAPATTTTATTLIVCTARDTFVRDLAATVDRRRLAPTLHTLLAARHVTLAFCPSVPVLLAYLAVYGREGYKHGKSDGDGKQSLVLVNPLALHAHTPAFSAQGLARSFAAAVDTAARVGAELRMVECQNSGSDDNDSNSNSNNNPWDQDISLLSISAPRFSADSGLATRTVTPRAVAARWFRFE